MLLYNSQLEGEEVMYSGKRVFSTGERKKKKKEKL